MSLQLTTSREPVYFTYSIEPCMKTDCTANDRIRSPPATRAPSRSEMPRVDLRCPVAPLSRHALGNMHDPSVKMNASRKPMLVNEKTKMSDSPFESPQRV